MKKLIRLWLLLLFLLIVGLPSLSAFAAEKRTYTIKQGDTLWGISERFIKDPYYWPSLWANNPDITNPHLIYPGQEVRLYNGRIVLIPQYPGAQEQTTETKPVPPIKEIAPVVEPAPVSSPTPVAETPAVAPESEKQVTVFKASGNGDGFILTDEKPLGTLIDSVDSRVLLTQNDLVFLNMNNPGQVKIGDTYNLFGRGPQITHPLTRKPFGTMMYDLGFVQITAINDKTIVGRIGDIYREVERGAELFEYIEPPQEIELKNVGGELAGHIISGQQSKLTQGQNDIVYIDLGLNNGLQVGNILYISRPRQAIKLAGKKKEILQLPDDLLGAAVVVETHNKSAAALIIKSVAEMHVGDQVMSAAR